MRKKDQWIIQDIYFDKSRNFNINGSYGASRHTKFSFGGLIKGGLTVLISVLIIFTVVKAGTITSPSGSPSAKFYTLSEIYEFIINNTAATEGGHSFTFSDALAGTGRTLTEIYSALADLISANKVKLGTTYLNKAGILTPIMTDGTATTTAVAADVFNAKTAHLTADWTLDTGALNLACATSTFDGTSNLVADAYDGDGSGANRWCMATSTNSASASDIVQYKSAWMNGREIAGTFASTTETATTTGVDITPSAGTWFSKITVAITNLIASVIKSGETVGGVSGSLLPSGGTATAANVATSTTFFGASQTNWSLQTGTFDPWSPQWLQTKDDWLNGGGTVGEYTAEEATWSAVSGSPFSGYDSINYVDTWGTLDLYSGTVKQDTRTSLWWSDIMAVNGGGTASTTDNSFTLSADGSRPTGGNAIGFCNALNTANFGGYNNWYLPTQKELMQAYIDGSANNLDRTGYYFWSSSEFSWVPPYAWYVYLGSGLTYANTKTPLYNVRCVRR